MNIEELYQVYLKHPEICTDTRNLIQNGLFFALKGDNFNGNQFAEHALAKGCAFAIIDEPAFVMNENYILVQNVLSTLQELALFHRKQLSIPIIGITGTNGKTTTKELLSAVLEKSYKIVATRGNLNNHIGVPLTVLSIRPETEIAVVEMGANHQGEIAFLCNICRPTHGLITNIGKAHLEGFGSFEGVVKTKNELYDFLIKNEKIIFANADNNILTGLLKDYTYVSYGSTNQCNCRGSVIHKTAFLDAEIIVENISSKYTEIKRLNSVNISSNLIGDYNLENILAAVTVGVFFGISSEKITEAIRNYQPDNNRSQLKQTEKNTLILDAYNANPSSMALAVRNFALLASENKVLILGDMLELGSYAHQEHLSIVELVKQLGFKNVFLVGKVFAETAANTQFSIFETTELLCEFLKQNSIENASVLIKGSRGIRLEKVIGLL